MERCHGTGPRMAKLKKRPIAQAGAGGGLPISNREAQDTAPHRPPPPARNQLGRLWLAWPACRTKVALPPVTVEQADERHRSHAKRAVLGGLIPCAVQQAGSRTP